MRRRRRREGARLSLRAVGEDVFPGDDATGPRRGDARQVEAEVPRELAHGRLRTDGERPGARRDLRDRPHRLRGEGRRRDGRTSCTWSRGLSRSSGPGRCRCRCRCGSRRRSLRGRRGRTLPRRAGSSRLRSTSSTTRGPTRRDAVADEHSTRALARLSRSRVGRPSPGLSSLSPLSASLATRARARRGPVGVGVHDDDRHADLDDGPDLGEDLGDHAREGRGELDERLGRLDLDDRLVHGDTVADSDVPRDDLRLGEAFAGVRHGEALKGGHLGPPAVQTRNGGRAGRAGSADRCRRVRAGTRHGRVSPPPPTPQNASERSTASSTLSRLGRYSCSIFATGYGVWNPPTRSTGASRS